MPDSKGNSLERRSSRTGSVPRLLNRFTSRAWEKDADIEGRRVSNAEVVSLFVYLSIESGYETAESFLVSTVKQEG